MTVFEPATLPDEVVDSADAHERLTNGLRRNLEERGSRVTVVESHISSVLVTKDRAYKIKKPVALPFLDFSTLALRKHFCEEELRLNRRLAPELYLAVVPVTGTLDAPTFHGAGAILDYAVMMRAFAQEALASEALARGAFTRAHTDALAAAVARFHDSAPRVDAQSAFGTPAEVLAPALANCSEIANVPDAPLARDDVGAIEAWTRREHAAIFDLLARRRDEGRVRECHGDLHLRNVAVIDGDPTLFDGIEFDARLRWIDVMSDVAFLVMDFHDRRRPDLGHRLLNAYLEHTGDYRGLGVLRFYLVYRAMVRAKVAVLRAHQLRGAPGFDATAREAREYLAIANRFTRTGHPALLVTHGVSGSGKSTATGALVELTGAIRVRTDIERKRLRGLAPAASSDSALGAGLYSDDATRRTYTATLERAAAVLDAGYLAIADGTFLRRAQRGLARAAAREHDVPFVFLAVTASVPALRQRVLTRRAGGGDASEATLDVLERQLATAEAFGADELSDVISYDSEQSDPGAADTWKGVLDRLAQPPIAPVAGTHASAALGERLAFLSLPASYPEGTETVTAIETHWSWVFLTDRFAYKLKKPVRTGSIDLTTVAARRHNAEEELRLNRRLAPDVYLGIEALHVAPDGKLALGANGTPVDWLVRMRRLPARGMLDVVLREGRLAAEHVRGVVDLLCGFYANQPPVDVSPERYVSRFGRAIAENARELATPAFGIPGREIERVSSAQERLLMRLAPALMERAAAERLREGHGDLRPEHIFVDHEPVVIDCLEFSRELRLLDPADEFAFLAIECERLGKADAGVAFTKAYRSAAHDPIPQALLDWYGAFRACTRARLAALHLAEAPLRPGDWRGRAIAYLALAMRHLERCG